MVELDALEIYIRSGSVEGRRKGHVIQYMRLPA
jgi:hypothetical protein